jgi:Tol biopolymer transport system component
MDDNWEKSPSILIVRVIRLSLALTAILAAVFVALIQISHALPAPPQIAFQSNRDGNWEIYLVDVQRRLDVRASRARGWDYAPAWSPDGTRVAFVSSRSGFFDIYMLDTRLRQIVQITDDLSPNTKPGWIDNTHIHYTVAQDRVGGDPVFAFELSTGNRSMLNTQPVTLFTPLPSPDSSKIAFLDDAPNMNLYIADASGDNARLVTPTGRADGKSTSFQRETARPSASHTAAVTTSPHRGDPSYVL